MSERVEEIREELPSWEGWLANLVEYDTEHSVHKAGSKDADTLLGWVRDLLAAYDALRARLAAAEELNVAFQNQIRTEQAALAAARRSVNEFKATNRLLMGERDGARRALEEMRQALKRAQYKSMVIVLSGVNDGEEREFIKWVQQEAKHIEKECAVAALLAPERPRGGQG